MKKCGIKSNILFGQKIDDYGDKYIKIKINDNLRLEKTDIF